MEKPVSNRLEEYCIEENVIGKGGFGKVYRGKLDKIEVAIKRLEQKDQHKFAEAELQSRLRHDNILSCALVTLDGTYRYYAFELAAGTMANLFTSEHGYTILGDRVRSELSDLQVLYQMASGLAYLHQEGIIHRDIKPQNILVVVRDNSVEMKLADFGLSKEVSYFAGKDSKSDLQQSVGCFTLTAIGGTPGWIAPELIKQSALTSSKDLKNAKAAGKSIRSSMASDIFAYGISSFYYLTKGIHPFGPCCDEYDRLLEITPNIRDNNPINFEKNLPIHNATRQLLQETIEHDYKKRISAQQIVSRLQVLKDTIRDEQGWEPSTLINNVIYNSIRNFVTWNFSEILQVYKLSEDGPRLINKCSESLKAPSFMDYIKKAFSLQVPIDHLREMMDRAVDAHFKETKTLRNTPLILFGYSESAEIPEAIGLLVPMNQIAGFIESLPEERQRHFLYYMLFCTSYSGNNLGAVIRLFDNGGGGDDDDHPIQVAFQRYQGSNLIELVGHLLKHSYNSNLMEDMNALHLACLHYKGDDLRDVVQFLIRGGIDVKAKVAESRVNALHMLCINYKGFRLKEIIELLVDGGIDPTDKTIHGWNALHFLSRDFSTGSNLKEIIQLLISYKINVNDKGVDGWSAFHNLCRYFNGPNLKEIVQIFIDSEIDVNDKAINSCNALHFLCNHYTGSDLIEIIDLLVKSGIDVKATTNEGWNGLHLACRYYRHSNLKDIIDLFIQNGIDLSAKVNDDWQVLHLLCCYYNNDKLKDIIDSLIVENNVDTNVPTCKSENALELLCGSYTRSNLKEIVRLLYDSGFRMETLESEAKALRIVCLVNRGSTEDLLDIVGQITEKIMQRSPIEAKKYINESIEILHEFNVHLNREKVIFYLQSKIEI